LAVPFIPAAFINSSQVKDVNPKVPEITGAFFKYIPPNTQLSNRGRYMFKAEYK
jgi:hypothetical protein